MQTNKHAIPSRLMRILLLADVFVDIILVQLKVANGLETMSSPSCLFVPFEVDLPELSFVKLGVNMIFSDALQESESELFTGDTSKNNHSPGPVFREVSP